MQPIVERAIPKVNLTLRIVGRRPDGYHELDSLVAFAQDIADIVTLIPGGAPRVSTSGPFGSSIAGENLVKVTLDLIAGHDPHLTLGTVELQKNLPIAAGIGGGSADAAAVIRAVQRANPAASGVDWIALATRIGADVPVCLQSNAQVMRGIGDRLTPVPGFPALSAVLVNPQVPVPANKTAQVFRALNASPLLTAPQAPPPAAFTSRAGLLGHMRATGNGLLPAACAVVPIVEDVLASLTASPGCVLAQLSGGGPTCFGIFDGMTSAQSAAVALSHSHPAWWIRASTLA